MLSSDGVAAHQHPTPLGFASLRRATLPLQGRVKERHFGARFAKIRCKVRRCMLRRRAVSDTLRPHSS